MTAEEPDGGYLLVRIWRGPRDRTPGLLDRRTYPLGDAPVDNRTTPYEHDVTRLPLLVERRTLGGLPV